MPYTLAHPIATAPLWYLSQRKFDLPALAMGSMVPDISYFIALHPVGNIGHSWQGILIECIPAGFLLLALFYGIIAQPLNRLLSSLGLHSFPNAQTLGSRGYRLWPPSQLLTITVSIILGAASHILWDSFTHRHGWFVDRIPLLQQVLLGLPLYRLLQYSGGLLGLGASALWLTYEQSHSLNSKAQPSTASLSKPGLARALAIIGIFTFGMGAIAILAHHTPNEAITSVIVQGVTGATSGLFLGLWVYSWVYSLCRWHHHKMNRS